MERWRDWTLAPALALADGRISCGLVGPGWHAGGNGTERRSVRGVNHCANVALHHNFSRYGCAECLLTVSVVQLRPLLLHRSTSCRNNGPLLSANTPTWVYFLLTVNRNRVKSLLVFQLKVLWWRKKLVPAKFIFFFGQMGLEHSVLHTEFSEGQCLCGRV